MSNHDWSKLYGEGRCQAIGVSFTEEQLNARFNLEIPASFVRSNIVTLRQYEWVKEKLAEIGIPSLDGISSVELRAIALKLGLPDLIGVTDDTVRAFVIGSFGKTPAEKEIEAVHSDTPTELGKVP